MKFLHSVLFLFPLLLIVLLNGCKKSDKDSIGTTNLRVEMLSNPVGIDTPNPRLSWEITGSQRGVEQTSYRILVASSPEKLDENEGDIWDSGRVPSLQSIHVIYDGIPLKSRMRCYWKVKTWTNKGKSLWSETAQWSMGLLYYKDWEGRWIGFDRAFPWDDEGFNSRLSARYFRKEFSASKEVKHASIYIIGLGLYELYINGEKIGDQVLAPSPTDYTQNVKYNVFDVTGNIQSGNNAIGVVLGNGRYYNMRQNHKPYKIKDFGYPKMRLQLEFEYTDGLKEIIKTDNSWTGTADGPIRSNNEFDGEEYDATKEMPGWNKAGFDDSGWLRAEYVQEPGGDYEARMNENMKVLTTVKPVSIKPHANGTYIMDMGQNMAGWVKMKVRGIKGTKVQLQFAEIINDDGSISTTNLRSADATDVYTLKGEGEEVWSPSFVYHGFRYVEILGYPGIPTVDDFVGEVVSDEMEVLGSFVTSNKIINQIFKNAYWGILSNYKGMPVDCPQRDERQPWLADHAVGAYSESFVFDNARLYAKWLDDIAYTQKADGCICDLAPPYYRYYSDNMTWPGTYLIVAGMLYYQFGDLESIKKHYPRMKKWLQYMHDRYMTEDYIITKDSYGDWCAPPVSIEAGRGKSANVKYPSKLISSAYYYHFMQLMQQFAKLTGNDADIEGYANLAEKVKKGFQNKFYNSDCAFYGDNKLTDNILPLYFGMVPEKEIEKVFANVIKTIEVTNNGHLSTGLVGTQWLMRCLTDFGSADLAYKIATNTTYPGWGYMVENGATTIWELWNGNTAAPNMNSYNHVMMLGDLIVWYYENLAGIKSSLKNPGFKEIIMKQELIHGLDYVNSSYKSMHGVIKSNWKKEDGKFKWDITVPCNSKAKVYIPTQLQTDVTESDGDIKKAEGVKFLKLEDGRAILEVGSGEYHFESKL